MIIHLKDNVDRSEASRLAQKHEAIHLTDRHRNVLVTGYQVKALPEGLEPYTLQVFPMESDIQLASRSYIAEKRTIRIGNGTIGGASGNTLLIAGPCSIESWEQISQCAGVLVDLGIKTLRAGCFKPRTSPYTFQGLGEEGLKMLARVREQYGLSIVTEVKDSSHVDQVIAYADVVQIGAKSMYDQSILRACGKSTKPVLLKRGFGTTLQELVQAAEFILSAGNDQVMLCERGIRTFETKTRFTLDLCGVAYLKAHTNLPVIVDPSHAMGFRYGVPDLARAATAMGIEGLLIEMHPDPVSAKSDAAQQLNFDEFRSMFHSISPIAAAIGRKIV